MKVNGDYVTDNGSYPWNDPEWIIIHYTAGSYGVTAEDNAIYYFNNGGSVQCGTHYFLGDDGIYQSTTENRGAWTNGNWDANHHAISIEVACGSDEPCFTDNEKSMLRELVLDIMERYDIDNDHVIRHYDVVDCFNGETIDPHKNCPRPYIEWSAWADLHHYITSKEDDMSAADVLTYNNPNMEFKFTDSNDLWQNNYNAGHILVYKNKDVNGDKDVYQLITDAAKCNERLDEIEKKQDLIINMFQTVLEGVVNNG